MGPSKANVTTVLLGGCLDGERCENPRRGCTWPDGDEAVSAKVRTVTGSLDEARRPPLGLKKKPLGGEDSERLDAVRAGRVYRMSRIPVPEAWFVRVSVDAR